MDTEGGPLALLPEQYFEVLAAADLLGPEVAQELAHHVLFWDDVQAACLAPWARVDGQELYPRLCDKAAVLAWRLLDLGLPSVRWKALAALRAVLLFVQQSGADLVDWDDAAGMQAAWAFDNAMDRRISLGNLIDWVCAQTIED